MSKLFEPFEAKGLRFKNRIIHEPTTLNMSDPQGYATRRLAAAYGALTRGGYPVTLLQGRESTSRGRITEREREMGITQASLPWHLRHHALFVCYGPVDNPRYACAVIVEHGQAGGATAGPIGRDVLVETMKRDPSRRTDRFKKMASR